MNKRHCQTEYVVSLDTGEKQKGSDRNTAAWSKAMKKKLHALIEEGSREGLIDALNSSCNLLEFKA